MSGLELLQEYQLQERIDFWNKRLNDTFYSRVSYADLLALGLDIIVLRNYQAGRDWVQYPCTELITDESEAKLLVTGTVTETLPKFLQMELVRGYPLTGIFEVERRPRSTKVDQHTFDRLVPFEGGLSPFFRERLSYLDDITMPTAQKLWQTHVSTPVR